MDIQRDEERLLPDNPHIRMLGFDQALRLMKDGKLVAREGWNGRGMFVMLCQGKSTEGLLAAYGQPFCSEMRPFIVMRTVQGDWVPWLASQSDLLADDWFLVGDST